MAIYGQMERTEWVRPMIHWIDIVAPALKEVHRIWIGLRRARLMPHLASYNDFAAATRGRVADAATLLITVPSDGRGATFRQIGAGIAPLLPGCREGVSLAGLAAPRDRDAVRGLLQRVFAHRQPDCHRGPAPPDSPARAYELLLLPFGDDGLRVCSIAGVCALQTAARSEAPS